MICTLGGGTRHSPITHNSSKGLEREGLFLTELYGAYAEHMDDQI